MTTATAHRLLALSFERGDRCRPGRTRGLWLVTSDTHGAAVWWRVQDGRCGCPAARNGKPCRHKIRASYEAKRAAHGEAWATAVLIAAGIVPAPAPPVDLDAEREARRGGGPVAA